MNSWVPDLWPPVVQQPLACLVRGHLATLSHLAAVLIASPSDRRDSQQKVPSLVPLLLASSPHSSQPHSSAGAGAVSDWPGEAGAPAAQSSSWPCWTPPGYCTGARAALRAVRKCRKCGENKSEFGRENGRYQIAEFTGGNSALWSRVINILTNWAELC